MLLFSDVEQSLADVLNKFIAFLQMLPLFSSPHYSVMTTPAVQ